MKKMYLILLIIIALLMGGIVYILYNNLSVSDDNEILEFKSTKHYSEIMLGKGSINKEIIISGIVTGDEYIKTAQYDYENACELLVDLDNNISAEANILRIDGKEIGLNRRIRIVNYEKYDQYAEITYLDYEELFIEAHIEEKYYNQINRQLTVKGIYNDNEIDNVIISEIGCEIVNGLIGLKLKSSTVLLPGSEIELQVIFDVLENQTLISNEFIKKDEKGHYLTYLEDEEENYVYVEIVYQGTDLSSINIDEEYLTRRFVNESY